MKKIQTLTIAALLVITGASMASATVTTYRVSGSSAYRASAITAFVSVLNTSGSTTTSNVTAAYTANAPYNDLADSSQSVIYGPVDANGNQTIVESHFTGSVSGLQFITDSPGATTSFPNAATYASSALPVTPGVYTTQTPASGGYQIPASQSVTADTASTQPDFIFSDVFKASTAYNSTSVKENTVGIVPFEFVASKGAPASIKNMTSQIAQNLFPVGKISLAFFSGLNADESTFILPLGRDTDSGTRLTALAETGIGVNTPLNQSYPLNSSGAVVGNVATGTLIQNPGPIVSTEQVPGTTLYGNVLAPGNSGYSSGANLGFALFQTNNTATPFVSYLGTVDGATAIAGGATALTYNGYSLSATNIEEGQYTFWGYEHLDDLSSAPTATKNFVTSLINDLKAGDDQISGDGISLVKMNVSRTGDGALVTATYY